MKTITLLLDGAGDRSYEELDWKTPLEYAHTPHLDQLARQSQCGLMVPHRIGCALGTDLAHMLIFGYSLKEYPNRALIDAIGEGIKIDEKTLILRASLADVSYSDGYFLNSRFTAELADEDIQLLSNVMTMEIKGCHFDFIHSYDSHGFIRVSGQGLSSQISDSDPFYNKQYVMAVEAFETNCNDAIVSAELVNNYLKEVHQRLKNHPINKKRLQKGLEQANMLLSKWASVKSSVPPFYERNGMSGLLIGQSKLLSGLASYIGMDFQRYETFEEGVALALDAKADYVHLHSKLPDTASHQKSPRNKVAAFEMLDQLIQPLLDFEGLLVVTADHSTPCSGEAIHSGESVPFMARGEYIRRDQVETFDEIACSRGSVMLNGKDFMHYIQNATDRGALYHLRAGGQWHNYKVSDVRRL